MTQITDEMYKAAFDSCAGLTGRSAKVVVDALYPLIRQQAFNDFMVLLDRASDFPKDGDMTASELQIREKLQLVRIGEHCNYNGAMADLEYLVDAFYRACPDNYFLNANYPREGSKEIVDQWVAYRAKVLEEAAKVCAKIEDEYNGAEAAYACVNAIRDMAKEG